MFDAKSILDILMKSAQPAPAQQQQGGLGDLLGKILQPQAQQAQAPQGGGSGGGFGDILGELQKHMGGAGQPQNQP